MSDLFRTLQNAIPGMAWQEVEPETCVCEDGGYRWRAQDMGTGVLIELNRGPLTLQGGVCNPDEVERLLRALVAGCTTVDRIMSGAEDAPY